MIPIAIDSEKKSCPIAATTVTKPNFSGSGIR